MIGFNIFKQFIFVLCHCVFGACARLNRHFCLVLRLGDFMKIAVFRFALSGGKSVLKVRKNMDKFSRKTHSFVSYSTTCTQA